MFDIKCLQIYYQSIYKVKLKQHTPMIHYQAREEGAVPRPGEMKPKLDRFLHKYFKTNEIPVRKEWYIDSSKNDALNYKMQIKAVGTPEINCLGDKINRQA